jgi:uncharacterized protein YcbX
MQGSSFCKVVIISNCCLMNLQDNLCQNYKWEILRNCISAKCMNAHVHDKMQVLRIGSVTFVCTSASLEPEHITF